MKRKKNPIIDLERYRVHFFLIGLIVTLLIIIGLINFKFYDDPVVPIETETYQLQATDDVIPITLREPPKKISAPKVMPEQIEIIEDAQEVEDEFEFATTETDEDEAITDKVYQQSDELGVVESIGQEYEEVEEPLAFAVVESAPVFPGCESKVGNAAQRECFKENVVRYVLENFEYHQSARDANISGRIFVQFIIEKDGRTAQVQVVRGLDPELDQEAERVVKSMPQMIPARQRGRPVRISFIVPIKLVLN